MEPLAAPDLRTSLESRRARVALAVGGVAVGLGGGLLVATSDHLVDARWYGAQVADSRGIVAVGWLLLGYLLHTTGELVRFAMRKGLVD